jgi:Ca2+-binding EF-hand superfamily protein
MRAEVRPEQAFVEFDRNGDGIL